MPSSKTKLRRVEARRVSLPENGLPRTAAKTTPIHPPAKSKQGPRQGVPESGKEKKARWRKVEKILEKEQSAPQIGLRGWKNPVELAIATILSAQCTDSRVNTVTQKLFKKYRKAGDYLHAKASELEKDIRSTGFYKNKTKNIRGFCAQLIHDHHGKVPDTMEQLVRMPGVGRKTANIILANAFGKNEGIAVDTHVFRVSRRMGFARGNNPVKVEKELMEIVERKKWAAFTGLLIWHGRKVCNARKPLCSKCPLKKYCPRIGVKKWE